MKKLMIVLMFSNSVLTVVADTQTVGDYTWTYRVVGNTAEACGTVYDWGHSCGITPFPTGNVTIPSMLGGKMVTSLDTYLFSTRYKMTGVTIPDSVTNIGTYVFDGCWGLTSVSLPNGVTNIGAYAFYDCRKLANMIIPDAVTSIGNCAFDKCTNLSSIVLGNGVTHIGNNAFSGCTGLKSVTIPQYICTNRISSIFPNAYQTLTNIVISEGVTSIGDYAFSGCASLANVTMPNSVTNIGEKAFSGCEGLSRVTIGGNTMSVAILQYFGRGMNYTPVSTTIVQQVEMPYSLTNVAADCAIASVVVNTNCAIDDFVLKDGKVYDAVLYIRNTADNAVVLTLPSGYAYKAVKGTEPLSIPANSQCILSITRVAESVFFVSREELETIQQ